MSAEVPSKPLREWRSLSGALGLFAFFCLAYAVLSQSRPAMTTSLWDCPVKSITSIPCFTCGITRVYLLLARGEVWDAFTLAPLPFFLVIGSLLVGVWFCLSWVTGIKSPDRTLGPLISRFKIWYPLVLLALVLWGYAIGRSIQTHAP